MVTLLRGRARGYLYGASNRQVAAASQGRYAPQGKVRTTTILTLTRAVGTPNYLDAVLTTDRSQLTTTTHCYYLLLR